MLFDIEILSKIVICVRYLCVRYFVIKRSCPAIIQRMFVCKRHWAQKIKPA